MDCDAADDTVTDKRIHAAVSSNLIEKSSNLIEIVAISLRMNQLVVVLMPGCLVE